MFNVLTLNNISNKGLNIFPETNYKIVSEIKDPDAILLRSYKMHDMEIPTSVLAIGRAGAGTNNIPIDKMSERGVPVFNAPGANANAVKELAIAGMLLGARNIYQASNYVSTLDYSGDDLNKAVEAGKKQFVGFELPGRTLGVIGLGSIGVEVANTALSLGMDVMGFDPAITVKNAWQLSSGVQQADSLEQLFQFSDFITLHIPLVNETRNIINDNSFKIMKDGVVLLNLARGEIVDNSAALVALNNGKLQSYVTDFPTPELIKHPKVVALPHLGASTGEAEENCAIMVAENVKDYLENGNIKYSVNFPEARLPRRNAWRITLSNENVPNMVGQVSTFIANAGLNIEDLLNKSVGNLAYTIVDVNEEPSDELINQINSIEGILTLRNLGKPT